MRTRLTVATASVLGLLLTGSAQAAPIVVEPEDLPRGASATITVSHGFQLRTAKGVIIPLPASKYGMKLLGRVADGWVVWDSEFLGLDGSRDRLYLIKEDATATMFHERLIAYDPDGYDVDVFYLLSKSRDRIAEVFNIELSGSVNVLDLDGNEVAGDGFGGSHVLDFSGQRMIVSTPAGVGRAESWRIDNEPRSLIERPANFADIGHDLLSRQMADGSFGLARISKPGAVRWKANWRPIRLSPDGTKLVGYTDSPSGPKSTVQIRRVSDGRVLRAFKVELESFGHGMPMAWENNVSVVFSSRDDDGARVLVRCKVGGYCARASAWFRGVDQNLSVAFETSPF